MPVRRDRAPTAGHQAVGWLAPGLLALLTATARAQPARPPVTSPASRVGTVEIVVAPGADDLAKIRAALGPHPFPTASVRWSSARRIQAKDVIWSSTPGSDAAVRAWVDLSDPTSTRLYFANATAERFLVRELRLSPSLRGVDWEAVGQVLELSVDSLLQDDGVGLDRSQIESLLAPPREAPPRADAPPPHREQSSTPAPSRPPLEVTAFYGARAFAEGMPIVHGPGLSVLSGPRGDVPKISLWLSGEYDLPQTFEGSDIGVELSAVVLRGGVESSWRVGTPDRGRPLGDMHVGGRIGLGADVVYVHPLPGSGAATSSRVAAYWSTTFVLAGAVRWTAALGAWLDLALGPTLDVYLTRAHYDFEVGGTRTTLLSPLVVRPGVTVGLTWR